MFAGKLAVGGNGIFGDTKDRHPKFFEFLCGVTKRTGFFGAAGGIVFGIKINNHPFAPVVGKSMNFLILVGQAEIGSGHEIIIAYDGKIGVYWGIV